jgi:plasmid maintenance system antidote protein VapI
MSTPASIFLQRCLIEKNLTPIAVASALSVRETTVLSWVRGKKTPLPKHQQQLSTLCGMTPEHWKQKKVDKKTIEAQLQQLNLFGDT